MAEIKDFKTIDNNQLIKKIYEEMDKLHELSNVDNDKEYWKEATVLNNMIIEAKERKIKVDHKTMYQHILF